MATLLSRILNPLSAAANTQKIDRSSPTIHVIHKSANLTVAKQGQNQPIPRNFNQGFN